MSEEFTTNPEAMPEGVTPEAADDDREYAEVEGEEASQDGEADAPEEEFEEVEQDGKKYKIPAALKDAILRHEDYTRKTQAVAEQRRALEQQQQAIVQQAEVQKANLADYAKLVAADERLRQYSQVDWQTWAQTDPIEAQKAYMAYQQLKDGKSELARTIQEREQRVALESQQAIAKRIEEGSATLAKEIPGWSPEVARNIREYAVNELGFSDSEVAQVYDPRVVKLLHKAFVGSQLASKATPKQTRAQAPAVAPAAKVKGGSSPKGEPRNIDDWMAWRNAQVRPQKGR